MRNLLSACVAAIVLAAANPIAAEDQSSISLAQAVAAGWRGEQAERDQFRHPLETIEFMRIEPGMTVIDFAPGTWYAKILIPFLGPHGAYIGATRTFATSSPATQAKQRVFPERFPRMMREEMDAAGIKRGARIMAYNSAYIPEEFEGSVDRVLVFRMMHNLHRRGVAHEELTNFRKLLKDDGLLGIVQHKAKHDAHYSYADGNNGYLREEDVIKLVEAHGFELVAKSEINANPKDPANHEGGVWQLPPVWASQDEALKEIGESDRMTLLFRKLP